MSQNMTVKARDKAYVVDIDGNRIPDDRYVTVPKSPGLIRAVKDGDLEQVEQQQHQQQQQHVSRRRRPETPPAA